MLHLITSLLAQAGGSSAAFRSRHLCESLVYAMKPMIRVLRRGCWRSVQRLWLVNGGLPPSHRISVQGLILLGSYNDLRKRPFACAR